MGLLISQVGGHMHARTRASRIIDGINDLYMMSRDDGTASLTEKHGSTTLTRGS
jgi:hypothetical protein